MAYTDFLRSLAPTLAALGFAGQQPSQRGPFFRTEQGAASPMGTGLTFNGGHPVPQPEYGRTHVYGPGTEGGYPLIPDPNPINNPARIPVGTPFDQTYGYGDPTRGAVPAGYAIPQWAQALAMPAAVRNALVNQWMWQGSPAFNAMSAADKARYLGGAANVPAAPSGPQFMGARR